MFRTIVLSAAAAGLVAALVLTAAQALWVAPLIAQAETYEQTEEPVSASVAEMHSEATHDHREHAHADVAAAAGHDHLAGHDHHHDASEWKPDDGWQRALFTLLSNLVMGFAYALLLIGVYTVWRRPNGITQGLAFGLAGFAVFFVAPGLGLPPELPGSEAAALATRQQWWMGTALATALGLGLLIGQKQWALRAIGAALLVAPHLIGAPHLAGESSLAPAALLKQFQIATAICNAVFWLLLGAISALALQRFSKS